MPLTTDPRRRAAILSAPSSGWPLRLRHLLYGAVLLTAASCGGETTATEKAAATEEATAPAAAPAAKSTAPAAATPLNVSMFLELSGGMKGFMPVNTPATRPTEFQERVSQLASRTRSSPAVNDAQFLLALKETPTATDYNHFRSVVQGDTHEAALGTELPSMLENILAQPNAAGRVNVIVSDFVYGPENKAMSGQMPVLITDALATSVSKKQLAVAVLGETSAFRGSFHPAVKKKGREKVTLTNGKLPYYIWVVGPAAAVGRYVNEVMPAPGPQTQQAYFGLRFPKVPYAAVLTQVPPGSPLGPRQGGSVSFSQGSVSTSLDMADVKDTVNFAVALDLRQLPAAWRDPKFLSQNLQVALPGGEVRLVKNSVQALSGVAALPNYSHVLRLRLTALPKAGGRLSISLPAPGVPAWVAQWSTDDDNQPGPTPRTYRLTEIMTGLRDAFPPQLPPVFTAAFTLSNDD
ncbi:hypothetical protein EJV47_02595 [Hymenobacter gummosus]|uniref:Uncharacterized protein n=1 Tax=Hymenobacter gummosus TaxID=1776032 RepID=A0A431U8R7_9BACT|nr:hypothetical protein [Hymenobacter gummosus]RTQ53643.1 hypothetical protein EJV47_02595 [Hymenobacter gummosus]